MANGTTLQPTDTPTNLTAFFSDPIGQFHRSDFFGSAICVTMDHDEAERGAVQGDAKLIQQSKQEGQDGSGHGCDE